MAMLKKEWFLKRGVALQENEALNFIVLRSV